MSTHDDSPELRGSAQSEFDRRAIGMVAHLLAVGISLERTIAKAPRLLTAWADRPDAMSVPARRITASTVPVNPAITEQMSPDRAPWTEDPLLRCVPRLEMTTDASATGQNRGTYQWA
jgi:hypothetical protein